MRQAFEGWHAVAELLQQHADRQQQLATDNGEDATHLNPGAARKPARHRQTDREQRRVIADEVGMGKTRIAVEVCRCVIESGGRAALLVPPGLGFQWQDELRQGGLHDVPAILRSLYSYLSAWADPPQPWFEKQAVMISHAFTNWRFGENSHVWRWALVPELYARWRGANDGRLPRGYHGNEILAAGWVCGEVAQTHCRGSAQCSQTSGATLTGPDAECSMAETT